MRDEVVDDLGEEMALQLAEILGEHAPDRLQQKIAQLVGTGGPAVAEPAEDADHVRDRLARHRFLGSHEHRLAFGEEHERVDPIGQVDQLELDPRRVRERARLPDLEALKGAEDDESGRRDVASRVRRVAPIVQRLRAVSCKPTRFARPLHLDDAATGPEEIEKAPLL